MWNAPRQTQLHLPAATASGLHPCSSSPPSTPSPPSDSVRNNPIPTAPLPLRQPPQTKSTSGAPDSSAGTPGPAPARSPTPTHCPARRCKGCLRFPALRFPGDPRARCRPRTRVAAPDHSPPTPPRYSGTARPPVSLHCEFSPSPQVKRGRFPLLDRRKNFLRRVSASLKQFLRRLQVQHRVAFQLGPVVIRPPLLVQPAHVRE